LKTLILELSGEKTFPLAKWGTAMKVLLLKLLNEYNDKYPELISLAEHTHKTKKWGMGVMPSYNPAPYTCELQGCKPGCLLKNSEPAKDRQCYFLDGNDNFIAEIQYAKYVKLKSQWIVYRRFFINEPNRIIELAFGSNFEDSTDANLDSASITTFTSHHPTARYSLLNTGEYVETLYKYDTDTISSITENIWRETFTTRHYKIKNTNDDLTILEILPDNIKTPVYPES
jgi:hypothetical protein